MKKDAFTLAPYLPRIKKKMLPNGLWVLVEENPSVPVLSIQYWCNTGSIHEGKLLGSGVSHFAEHLMFKGTKTRKGSEMDREIQSLGGHTNAYTSFNRTVYYVDMPKENWGKVLEILTDAQFNSTFPEEEFEKEREVIRREFAMTEDNPDWRLFEATMEAVFVRHPYCQPIIGHLQLFNSLSREEVWEYYRERYAPQNLTLIVSGDVKIEEVFKEAERLTKNEPRRFLPDRIIPSEPLQKSARHFIQEFPTDISRLSLSFPFPGIDHPDTPAMEVLTLWLSGGKSSLLHQLLVEKEGLAEEISASFSTEEGVGLWGVYTRSKEETQQQLITRLREILYSLSSHNPSEQVLERARNQFLTQQLYSLQTTSGKAAMIGVGWQLARDPLFNFRFLEKIQKVTLEDILRVAEIYFKPEQETLVELVPEKKDEKASEDPQKKSAEEGSVKLLKKLPPYKVLHLRDQRLPLVGMRASFDGSLATTPDKKAGLPKLASRLLVKASQRLSSEELSAEIENLGGSIHGSSGLHSISLAAGFLSRDWEKGFDLFSEAIFSPRLGQEDFEIEKRRQLGALQAQKDEPLAVVRNLVYKTLYAGTPYESPALGNLEDLEKMELEDVQRYVGEHFCCENTIWSLAGDVSEGAWVEKLEKTLKKGDSSHTLSGKALTVKKLTESKRIEKTHKKEQAIIQIIYPTASFLHEDREELEVFTESLRGLSSRLFRKIREEMGLAYFVSAGQFSSQDAGHLCFFLGTSPEKRQLVEKVLLEEIEKIVAEGLSTEEVDRSRTKLLSEMLIEAQDSEEEVRQAAVYELSGLGWDYRVKKIELIKKVSKKSVHEVILRYLKDMPCLTAILSPE